MMVATATAIAAPTDDDPAVWVRCHENVIIRPPGSVTESFLACADPYRRFRWYKGQKHYSGLYFSATEGRHVGYESRLELARAVLADFAPDVQQVISQPFLLRARVDGKMRRHIPDYLLFSDSGLTVVAVKPRCMLTDPKVTSTFAWVQRVVESAGWRFEVFSEPDPALLGNVRFFAGYRRAESVSASLLGELRSRDLVGLTFGAAARCVAGPAPRVRAALLHMLWRQELRIDLSQPLCASTLLETGVRS
jgi:hypothetical protein